MTTAACSTAVGTPLAEQDLADLAAALQVRRQRPVGVQAAEVDDAAHAAVARRPGDDRRGTPVDRREVAVDQGVDEEVHDIDPHAGAPHGVLVEQVAAHHLGIAGPRDVAQLRGVAHQAAHGVALGQEPRGQPAADVAGGAGDEMSHGSMLPRGGRVGMSTDDVGLVGHGLCRVDPTEGPRSGTGPAVPATGRVRTAADQVEGR